MNSNLVGLVSALGVDEIKMRANRMKRTAIAYAIAGVLVLVAVACAIAAAIIYLGQLYGPVYAALGVAGVFVAIAIVCVIVVTIINSAEMRRQRNKRAARQSALMGAAVPLVPLIVKSRLLFGLTAVAGSAFLAARYFGAGPFGGDDDS